MMNPKTVVGASVRPAGCEDHPAFADETQGVRDVRRGVARAPARDPRVLERARYATVT